jgi:hypothetical protein
MKIRVLSALLLLAALGRPARADDPLEQAAASQAKMQSKDAAQVGEFFRGAGAKTDYQVMLEAGKCYWFSGAGENVKKLYLYLWSPGAGAFTPRVADAKSTGNVTMAYCAEAPGMYKFQVKTEGKGRYVVGLYAKQGPPPAAAQPVAVAGPKKDLGPICDKTAHTASVGAKRQGDFFEGKGSSIGHDDRSDYTVQMEAGKCYWVVGCADPDAVKSLYLFLWGPNNKRITEAKSDNPNPMIGHCAAQTGMFKVQAKMNSGKGEYRVGVYVK